MPLPDFLTALPELIGMIQPLPYRKGKKGQLYSAMFTVQSVLGLIITLTVTAMFILIITAAVIAYF